MAPVQGLFWGGSIGWWSRDNLSRDHIDHVNDGRGREAQGSVPACAGVNHDVLGMPAGARMGSVPTIDYDVIPEGMSAQPALFLHWEPNWARSSITIMNSTCLIFGSENPQI